MKRDKRLYPLSWNHRDLLVFADRVRMALTTDHPHYRQSLESLVEKTKEFWSGLFLDHMWAEVNVLFRPLKEKGRLFKSEIETLEKEYAKLSKLYQEITNYDLSEEIQPRLIQFADLVTHHVRYEERVLFVRIQEGLSEKEFDRIGEDLINRLPKGCRTKPKVKL